MKTRYFLPLAAMAAMAQADELSECATLESDEARLNCYDEAAQRAAAPAEEAAPAAAEPAPATTPASVPQPKELFGKSAEETSEIIAEAAGVENVDEISGKVVAVARDPYRRHTVTLDNGQKWTQTRTDRFDVDVGDDVTVRKATLGSFTMKNETDGGQTKVRRVD